MAKVSRRRFLQSAGGLTAAGLTVPASATLAAENRNAPLKFQLGIVTYNIAQNWDRETIIKVLKNVGLAAVEFRTTHKHGVEPSLTREERKDIRKRFADSPVKIWGCGTTCEFHATNQAEVKKQIETCKRFVDLVADIGGRGVKVRPNGLPKTVAVDKTLEQIGKSLIPCGKAAADAGVEIWVEVHGGTEHPPDKNGQRLGSQHPPYMKKIMEHCGQASVGVTWNSNQADLKNKSVAEYFQLLKPWIRSCHINEIWKDARGIYPYRELFRLLRESGYDRVTLIEVGRSMPTVASGEELLRYYKALWQELTKQ